MIIRTALRTSEGFINLIVYRYLKTFNIMAKFTLKFLDVNHLSCDKSILVEKIQIENLILIELTNNIKNQSLEILLDKSTAIKFAKTLRTEINKIVE